MNLDGPLLPAPEKMSLREARKLPLREFILWYLSLNPELSKESPETETSKIMGALQKSNVLNQDGEIKSEILPMIMTSAAMSEVFIKLGQIKVAMLGGRQVNGRLGTARFALLKTILSVRDPRLTAPTKTDNFSK